MKTKSIETDSDGNYDIDGGTLNYNAKQTLKSDGMPSESHKEEMANELSEVLADIMLLSLKYQGFHWNVTGPRFNSLHLFFEEQYARLNLDSDEIAERIRALGFYAPGNSTAILGLASIKEENNVLIADKMIDQLLSDHELISKKVHQVIGSAESLDDYSTAEILNQRLAFHEKSVWILKSLLQ